MNLRRVVPTVIACLALAACSDGPEAGAVTVTLTGASAARSVELRVVGPITSYDTGDPSVSLFPTQLGGDTLAIVAVAAQGHTLNGLPLAQLEVADKDAARGYHTQIVGVAAANYALLNAADFSVSISH